MLYTQSLEFPRVIKPLYYLGALDHYVIVSPLFILAYVLLGTLFRSIATEVATVDDYNS